MFSHARKIPVTAAVVIMIASFLLAACAPAATPTAAPQPTTPPAQPTTAPAASGKPFKVGFIHPSPITDYWSGLGWAAVQRMKKELGAQVSEIQVSDPSQYEKALSDYGSQGYNFVIAHGREYQDAVAKVSPQFPKTFFTTSGGTKTTANYSPIDTMEGFAQYQYALCAMVGKISKTHKGTGFTIENAATKNPTLGCQAGFESIPGNKFNVVILSDGSDTAAAKEAAIQAISNGSDVLMANADLAGQGVLQGVVENGNKNIYYIGVAGDYTKDGPNNVVVSISLDFGEALVSMAKAVKDGTAVGNQTKMFTINDPGVYPVIYNPNMDSVVTPELKAFFQDDVNKIKSGEIQVLDWKMK